MTPSDDLIAARRVLIKRYTKTQALVVNLKVQTVTMNEIELLEVDISNHKDKAEELYEKTGLNCPEADFKGHDDDFITIFASIQTLQTSMMN